MSGVRYRRLTVLVSDDEWAAIQAIPRNVRAGKVGVALGAAFELGQFNSPEPGCAKHPAGRDRKCFPCANLGGA